MCRANRVDEVEWCSTIGNGLSEAAVSSAMRNRPLAYLAIVFLAVAALILVLGRPWHPRARPAEAEDPVPPATAAAVRIVKLSGGACQITIVGESGNTSGSSSASLPADYARSAPIHFPAP